MNTSSNAVNTPPRLSKQAKRLPLNIILPLLLLIAACLYPLFNASPYFMTLVILGISYAIVVIGQNVLLGYTGQFSLGTAGFFGIGAYGFAIATTKLGTPFWVGVLVSIALAVVFGLVIGITTSKLSGHYLGMVTICFVVIVNLVLSNWILITNGPDGISGIPRPTLFGLVDFTKDVNFYYFSLLILLLVMWFGKRLKSSRTGRAMEAVRENEMAAAVTGVRTYQIKVTAFVISSALAGLGGAIYASGANYISPSTFTFDQSVIFLTMTVVGGSSSVYGGVLGALLLTFLPEWLRFLKDIYLAVYGLMVILFVLFMPKGIWNLTTIFKRFFKADAETLSADVKELLLEKQPEGSILTVKGLSKHFGGLKAVDLLDFNVASGEVKALIGPNGSGKTTVLNLLTGLYTPTSGEIIFEDHKISKQRPEDITELGIARTFQNIRLFSELSVLENVMVGQTCRTKQGIISVVIPNRTAIKQEKQVEARAMAALAFVGLADKKDWLAKNLPYGQQRLVEIARALATQPKLLLLDEPAAGLNPSETDELVKLLQKLNDYGLSMFLVEHDMSLVKKLATSVTVLNFGQKIAEGDVNKTLQDPIVVEAYLGKEDEEYA